MTQKMTRNEEIGLLEFEMDSKRYIPLEDVREEIRLLADSMSTHKAFAEKASISPQYLNDILQKKRLPGKKILAFLKLKAVIVYEETRK
jgi:hypothetical protein